MFNRAEVCGFSSTFCLATRTRPAISAASWSTTGAIMRQGPHQGAHKSSNTGSGDCSTSAVNVASVIVSGFCPTINEVLQRPHTGSSPAAIFSCGTRFFAPHEGHWMTWASGMILIHPSGRPPGDRGRREKPARGRPDGLPSHGCKCSAIPVAADGRGRSIINGLGLLLPPRRRRPFDKIVYTLTLASHAVRLPRSHPLLQQGRRCRAVHDQPIGLAAPSPIEG